jgi:MFS family permease
VTAQQNEERKALKAQKIQIREGKELVRREAQLNKKKPKLYLVYLMLIITLAYITDEVASNISGALQSSIVREFFIDPTLQEGSQAFLDAFDKGLSNYSLISLAFESLTVLSFFYKTLADRFGRRPFLIINTFGMALGMFVCYIQQNMYFFFIGLVIINFFIPNDMQVVYILETAPEKKRGAIYSIIKGVASLGIEIIPLMRKAFMGDDWSKWRWVYLVPALIGFGTSFLTLFFAGETDAFLKKRIDYLQMTPGQKQKEKEDKKAKDKDAQGGLKHAMSFAFSHKQLKWLFLVVPLFLVGSIGTQYYESAMKTSGLTTDQITMAETIYPFGIAFITLIYGFFSDKFGRKPVVIGLCFLALADFILFIFGIKNGWNPYLDGAFIGLFVGSYWSASDTLGIMSTESCPTNLRASVLSGETVMAGIGMGSSMVLTMLMLKIPSLDIGYWCLGLSVPFLAVALVMFILKVGETKGLNMDDITGAEWDEKKKAE